MPHKPNSRNIEGLDAQQDYHRIAFLLAMHIFSWDIERALEFALFRTFAVPSISGLLARTRQFTERTRKRYDDTELILYEILENGFESERAKKALRRMNSMHGRFVISNDDYLYVLSTFVLEPIRWIERFGWRPLSRKEIDALVRYYQELGRRMNIKDIPESYEAFNAFNLAYEQARFAYANSNQRVGKATVDLLLGFYLPRWLYPLGRPVAYCLMDEPLLKAMGFPRPPVWLQQVVLGAMRSRAFLLRFWPERRKPRLGTQRHRPTYPNGYRVEELGTF